MIVKSLYKTKTIRKSSNHSNAEIVLGTDSSGRRYFYHITDEEERLVKKVYTDTLDSFIEPDLRGLDEVACRINTKLLWAVLIERGYDAILRGTNKKPVVRAYDYDITCNEYGFYIRDERDFYKPLNYNDFGDEFPDIDSVIKLLKDSKDRPVKVIDPTAVVYLKAGEKIIRRVRTDEDYDDTTLSDFDDDYSEDEDIERKPLVKSVSPFKPTQKMESVSIINTTHEIVRALRDKPELGKSMDELAKEFVSIHTELGKTRPRYSYDETVEILKEKVYPMIDYADRQGSISKNEAQPLKVRLGIAFGKTRNLATMCTEAVEAFGKTRVKSPAPPYWGEAFNYDWEHCICKGDEVEYRYRSTEGNLITKNRLYWQILWRQILNKKKDLMPLLMLTAEGKYSHLGECKMVMSKEHKFVHFDKRVLDNPKHTDNFIECVEDWASYLGLPYLWLTMYDNSIKVGTDVKVLFPDLNKWYVGKVLSTRYGIEVTFTDGTLKKLKNTNTLKVYKKVSHIQSDY